MPKLVKPLGVHIFAELPVSRPNSITVPVQNEWKELVIIVRRSLPEHVRDFLQENQARQKWAWMQPVE